jgi:hypothetical protein
MGDRIAMERLAIQKLVAAQTERANEFISRLASKSLGEIDHCLAEPFSYLRDSRQMPPGWLKVSRPKKNSVWKIRCSTR